MNTFKLEIPSLQNLNRMMKSSGYHVVNTDTLAKASNQDNYTPSFLDNVSARKFIVDYIINVPNAFNNLPEIVQLDRAICIDIVSVKPELLRLYTISIRDDADVIRACLKSNPTKNNANFWAYVSPRLRQRKWIRDLAFKWSPFVFEHFTPTQQKNDEIGKKAFKHSPFMFFYLSEKLQNDWKVLADFLHRSHYTLEDLNSLYLSKDIIAKVGPVDNTVELIAALYDYGLPKSSNGNVKRTKI